MKKKITIFWNTQIVREFITIRPALQKKMLKAFVKLKLKDAI